MIQRYSRNNTKKRQKRENAQEGFQLKYFLNWIDGDSEINTFYTSLMPFLYYAFCFVALCSLTAEGHPHDHGTVGCCEILFVVSADGLDFTSVFK